MMKMKLWESDIPGYFDGSETPALTYYPTESKRGRGTVVILPGGGYSCRAPHEGEGYALYLNSIGLDAFVVDYRVSPTRFPYPLLDSRRAIRTVRANAEKYGIDPDKVAIMGSSAGGHLASITATYKKPIDGEGVDEIDAFDYMPNAQILCYPVIDIAGHVGSFNNLLGDNVSKHKEVTSYLLADKSTPPLFLWHTSSDGGVDVNNSLRYATRLHELGIPYEMHIYPIGVHGLGLANTTEHNRLVPYVQDWAMHLEKWLRLNGWFDN